MQLAINISNSFLPGLAARFSAESSGILRPFHMFSPPTSFPAPSYTHTPPSFSSLILSGFVRTFCRCCCYCYWILFWTFARMRSLEDSVAGAAVVILPIIPYGLPGYEPLFSILSSFLLRFPRASVNSIWTIQEFFHIVDDSLDMIQCGPSSFFFFLSLHLSPPPYTPPTPTPSP